MEQVSRMDGETRVGSLVQVACVCEPRRAGPVGNARAAAGRCPTCRRPATSACGSRCPWWGPGAGAPAPLAGRRRGPRTPASGRSGAPAYEHPRGAGPFVGPQLLGASGWAGSGLRRVRLRSRDAWVGWDDARRAHLHRVLALVPAAGAPTGSAGSHAARVSRRRPAGRPRPRRCRRGAGGARWRYATATPRSGRSTSSAGRVWATRV